ncbi:Hsp20/alpha crystallin family protein [Nitrosococcus wardiae]|uniref:Hsp20/alpha crystallin family protein n=1 Tax=Nitrosococcus wardiae TaxID=1814290 RepID=A0A4P7C1M7_9GAMM|nr:Hsp20/alpha crystallin family protein [Nitrosococcus wardiae]QBQ55589.1 Hsp20/alpha crystallin family protein [Nitrosococcus wardiae]
MPKESGKPTSETGKEIEKQRVEPTRMLSPFEEMERWFESAFPRGWMRPFQRERPMWGELTWPPEGRIPRVDVVDRDEEVVVRAELPGVEKKDLDISVTDNTVTIKATTSTEEKEEKGDYYRHEISRGSFARTVTLPSDVESEKGKASFKEGILELTLPKVKKSKRRRIKVE